MKRISILKKMRINKIYKTRKQIISSITKGFLATLLLYVTKGNIFTVLNQKIYVAKRLVTTQNSDQLSRHKDVSNRSEIIIVLMQKSKALWV